MLLLLFEASEPTHAIYSKQPPSCQARDLAVREPTFSQPCLLDAPHKALSQTEKALSLWRPTHFAVCTT